MTRICCLDLEEPQRLALVSQTIAELAEGLLDLVNELERARERRPEPRQARALYMLRNSLETAYLDMRDTWPDWFVAPPPAECSA